MNKKLHLITLLLVILSMSSVLGQKALDKANKQYELGAYEEAITSYFKVFDEHPGSIEAREKLAECYRLTNNYIDAIRWYEKAENQSGGLSDASTLNFANTLKTVGLYDKAQRYYWKYKKVDPAMAEHYAVSCDYAKNLLSGPDSYQISLCKFNSKNSDFGVSFYEDQMVFASFRKDFNSKPTADSRCQLFIETGAAQDVALLRKSPKESFGYGAASFSRDGKMIAYTKNQFVDGDQQVTGDDKNLSIYLAITDDSGDFGAERSFPYNNTDFSNAFPNISYNGNALYFASNRPGGYGGFDLYVSYFKKGEWTQPDNLGPDVNTRGNEITPFFDGETLYYSSDYTQGIGGYDIFMSVVTDGKWSFPENLGKGINSPSDDYYFAKNMRTGEMFFTSNRLGGRGGDDVYIASKPEIFDYAVQEEEENQYIPTAVNLDDLEPIVASELTTMELKEDQAVTKRAKVVPVADETTITVISDEATTSTRATASVSLVGARRIATGRVINTSSKVYFIQLASLSRSQGDLTRYQSLVYLGNLYRIYKSNATKIKLGYYMDQDEAQSVLRKVRSAGFRDAFITNDDHSDSGMEMISTSTDRNRSTTSQASTAGTSTSQNTSTSQYKVRIASYTNPLWFDTEQVKDLGKIEQWTKGEWTIFVLSGYGSYEDAQSAQISALNRGFGEAEVVLDNNGILERLQRN